MDFVFIIDSCVKNLEKSNLLFNLLDNFLTLNKYKSYIVYGDANLQSDYEIKDNKYLVLKCGDSYDHLSHKTIKLFETIETIHPECKGIIKCDDDIIPNKHKLKELYNFIMTNNVDYLGNVAENESDFLYYHGNRLYHSGIDEKFNKPLLVKKCRYNVGPMYYVSLNAIKMFNRVSLIKDILIDQIDFYFEDIMVGYILNNFCNIFPIHYKTYYDNIEDYRLGSIQNIRNAHKKIFIFLHAGLGNQLFQVAAGFEMAKKHNMFLILVYNDDFIHSFSHNTSLYEFLSSIFSFFNYTSINNIDLSKVITYNESKCFDYNDSIIQHNSDYYLTGYFQNKKYLENYKNEFLDIIKDHTICDNLNLTYPLLNESYFIHVRRGDYLQLEMYSFDKDNYFEKSIEYILNKEGNQNVHFFILSDDINFCKTYEKFNNINKTFINEMNTLDSLYFMSLCVKGGICSNSTFSGWATNLNCNQNKTIIFPTNFINIGYPYEIPFDFTVSL